MVCLCSSYHLLVLIILKTYVKGYVVDMEKIKVFLNAPDIKDSRIDHAMVLIMGSLDREAHRDCVAQPVAPPGVKRDTLSVIPLNGEAFSKDLEELRQRVIPIPGCLRELAKQVLSGPDVFEVVG
jgi:hypothetical protein